MALPPPLQPRMPSASRPEKAPRGRKGLLFIRPIIRNTLRYDALVDTLSPEFWPLVLVGFVAQLIDGAMGMAYGVSASAFLTTMGHPPAFVSATVHAAEVVTTGAWVYRMRGFGISIEAFLSSSCCRAWWVVHSAPIC